MPTHLVTTDIGVSVLAPNGNGSALTNLPGPTYGTGVSTALAIAVGSAGAIVVNGGVLGTPSSGTLTSCTGLPVSTGLSGAGTGILTALAVNVGSAGAPVLFNGAGGTPSSINLSNGTALPNASVTGLGALATVTPGTGVATFATTPSSANLLAAVTDETGTGALVFATSPALVTPALGVATATSLNGNTFTTGTYTLTGAAGKTLTFSNTLTLAGTDSSTLNIGAGGTLGTGAFATAFNPAVPGAIGGTTPAAGAFTTLATSGLYTASSGVTVTNAARVNVHANSGKQSFVAGNNSLGNYNGMTFVGGADGEPARYVFGFTDYSANPPPGWGWYFNGDLFLRKITSNLTNPDSITTVATPFTWSNTTGFSTTLDLICATAGKGLQLKSGTGARAGNAVLVGGTVTVTNTTVTANSIIYCGRKTAGGTLGQSLSYTVSAGTSFTITSVDATGVLSALDTSTVSFIIVELN